MANTIIILGGPGDSAKLMYNYLKTNFAIEKVILENAYLTESEKVTACKLTEAAGAHYVKTSTGYAPTGATIADIKLMRSSVSPKMKIKSAGGVRTLDVLIEYLDAGISRSGATTTAIMIDEYAERFGRD